MKIVYVRHGLWYFEILYEAFLRSKSDFLDNTYSKSNANTELNEHPDNIRRNLTKETAIP